MTLPNKKKKAMSYKDHVAKNLDQTDDAAQVPGWIKKLRKHPPYIKGETVSKC